LKQISERAQAKQQQQQQDHIAYQKSMYGAASAQAQHALQAAALQAAAHPIPLGVRSFLDPGDREPSLFATSSQCDALITNWHPWQGPTTRQLARHTPRNWETKFRRRKLSSRYEATRIGSFASSSLRAPDSSRMS
jgi:hypothetical protein